MDILRNWKIHVLVLCIVVISEKIGMIKYGLIILLPLLHAMVLGGVVSYPKFNILSIKQMEAAAGILPIAMMLLIVKIGLDIGPNLSLLFNSKGALLFQEIGHFFGTVLLGLPIAVFLNMGREAIGATYSVAREPNIAIIAEKYGLDSPEGRGVMAMYICGTLFGAAWLAILTGVVAKLGILHPYALAMGSGVGSGSMMAASVGSIIAAYPDMEQQIRAYAGAANLMSSILGIYVCLFFSLPLANKMYDLLNKFRSNAKETI
ncbi:MAG: DUF3100 domain-containing protein [Sporomusa sp.]